MQFKIKQKQEYVNKTFRISKDLVERLSVTATKNNVSLNELVVQSCEFALEHLKSEPEKEK